MENRILLEISLLLEIPVSSIDLHASFVQMGGNSLSAIDLARACESNGIHLGVESLLSSPSISDLLKLGMKASTLGDAEQWDLQTSRPKSWPGNVKDNTRALTTATLPKASLHDDPSRCRTLQRRPSTPSDRTYPMTEMQLSLIYGSQNNQNTNIINHYETYRSDDIPAVRKAWKAVIDSEPIFRTTFILHEGKGRMAEQGKARFNWSETTVSSQEEFDTHVGEVCFETSTDMSFQVITLSGGQHGDGKSTIIWRVHHALIDGYSSNLIISKLRRAIAGMPIYPGPSFARFAGELDAFQQRSEGARRLFWKRKQAEYSSAAGELLLAAPISRLHHSHNASEIIACNVPLAEISAFAQRLGITSASVYYAAWALALSVYVGSNSTVFGVVLSGRNLPIAGIENVVGPVINMLPFHVSLNGAAKTVDYLHHTFSRLIELMSVQCSRPDDGFSRQFSSAMAIQFEVPTAGVKGRDLSSQPYSRVISDIPLYVLVEADGTIRLDYHTNTYHKTHMVSLGESFSSAIFSLLIPDHTISMCLERLMSYQVRSHLQKFGNFLSSSTIALSTKEDLVTLFEKVAPIYPNAVAVEKDADFLSYAELNDKAACVAHRISSLIQPGEVVCVHADRSIQWIIAIYGILKAGAIYCPFDESWPTAVRDSNFEAARGRLFLAPKLAGKAFRPSNCALYISVEELLIPDFTQNRIGAFLGPRCPRPETNAYLCFTSGSTGLPKGVMCRHESVVAFQGDLEVRLFAAPGHKVAQIMSPAFDGSIHEIFSTLSYGATLILGNAVNPVGHLGSADSAILTPSIAKVLDPADFPKLRAVYLILYNMYGPTEATCGATIKRLRPEQPVTIGIPNPSMRIYILDTRQSLIPPGVIGEIYLAGIQISEGYVGRPMETAKYFMPDWICRQSSKPMYKTGDYGYWNPDGELVCLGRKDRQIKLRGFRIDLNDLEIRMLKAVPNAKALALIKLKDSLVAMVQPSSLDVPAFRSKVARLLPVHALPRHIVAVDEFPLTRIGKVDYAAMANTEYPIKTPSEGPFRCPALKVMVAIWREVLNLAPDVPIGSESNFIDLGGNSIQQMLLSNKLTARYGGPVSMRMILEYPILNDLAKEVKALHSCKLVAGPNRVRHEHELSPIEKDWWDKYESGLGSSAFNVNFVSKIGKDVDLPKLTLAWNTILARHRILSCRYTSYRRSGVRRVFSEHPPRVEHVRYIDIWQEINRPFDLRLSNLITVSISADCIVVRISHIICDLTTLRTLLHEVGSVYDGSCIAEINRTFTESMAVDNTLPPRSLDFWSEYLANAPSEQYAISRLQHRASYGGASEICKISVDLFHDLIEYTAKEKVTFHQISLAAIAMALQHGSGPHDIVLGAPYLNRRFDEDMKTIGLFLEPLPIRIRYPFVTIDSGGDGSDNSNAESKPLHESFIHSVRASSQAALSHAIPWTELLGYLQIASDFPEHPLFSVMVTFHDDRQENKSPLPGCKKLYTWSEGAKFSLMTEFLAVSEDTFLLRVEYDSACFRKKDVEMLQELVVAALRNLITGASYDEMKERMREVRDGKKVCENIERRQASEFFGVEMDKL
ncbi:MAG: hypothetical protein ASARMPRED_008215 [Alectoria sarmentosa]|nr:MAG: hypothetical protein ASARMPRED_008215 [Alectoria sarmentosa]